MVQVWESLTWGCESRRNGPVPSSLLQGVNWLGQRWRAHPCGKDREELVGWPILLLPGPKPRIINWSSQHPLHLWSEGACKRDSPANPKLQDHHDTGQQNIQNESQKRSGIYSVAEPRGLNQTNHSFHWTLASNNTKKEFTARFTMSHCNFYDKIFPSALFFFSFFRFISNLILFWGWGLQRQRVNMKTWEMWSGSRCMMWETQTVNNSKKVKKDERLKKKLPKIIFTQFIELQLRSTNKRGYLRILRNQY